MASFNAQALLREVGLLLATLKSENHPSAQRLSPLYDEKAVREIVNCWQTLQCVKQELCGLQASMQHLTVLVMSVQQKLHHPSDCYNFSTPQLPPSPSGQSVQKGPEQPPAKPSSRGDRKSVV